MIRINRQTDYAVRVLLSLSKRTEGRTSTAEIQREMLIPPSLAQRIVADLARGGFVQTFPGRDGGLSLARAPKEINLRQIVEHFEGRIFVSDCLIGKGECPFDNNCPVRCRWAHLQATVMQELEQITFEDLAQEALSIESIVSSGIAQS